MEKSRNSSDHANSGIGRRDFVKRAGFAGIGVGVAGAALLSGTLLPSTAQAARISPTDAAADTAQQIFTAALIAEDLAITMYYNSLVGGVIQDPNLAGNGSVTNPDNLANVGYLQGALAEEIVHANLLRSLIGGSSPATDPVQTFYFPTGTFDNLENFVPVLVALETAFVGAYLTAVQEFSMMSARIEPFHAMQYDYRGKPYSSEDLSFYAKVAASIMGVESEHRTLARAIPSISLGDTTFAGINLFPADNVNFEQTDGLKTVYNGPNSAVVALTPFITAGSGKTAFTYATAIANSSSLTVPTTGGLPV